MININIILKVPSTSWEYLEFYKYVFEFYECILVLYFIELSK